MSQLRYGLLRARRRPLIRRGKRMEVAWHKTIMEVNWVGWRRTAPGPPMAISNDKVRKVSLKISTYSKDILIIVMMVAMALFS